MFVGKDRVKCTRIFPIRARQKERACMRLERRNHRRYHSGISLTQTVELIVIYNQYNCLISLLLPRSPSCTCVPCVSSLPVSSTAMRSSALCCAYVRTFGTVLSTRVKLVSCPPNNGGHFALLHCREKLRDPVFNNVARLGEASA